MSPSTRREWIEISASSTLRAVGSSLPPHGGSGLKCIVNGGCFGSGLSPSTRREWIEMHSVSFSIPPKMSPSTRREWIEMLFCNQSVIRPICLPPHGGSGLKYRFRYMCITDDRLPPHGGSGLKFIASMRNISKYSVSLHTEGVD